MKERVLVLTAVLAAFLTSFGARAEQPAADPAITHEQPVTADAEPEAPESPPAEPAEPAVFSESSEPAAAEPAVPAEPEAAEPAEPAAAEAQPAASGPARVVIIPVRSQISKPELYILRRGIKDAVADRADTLILDMKTPGGSVAVTLEMMEALDRFGGRTITYVNDEAMSAGAIIAAVTDEIHFSPTAVIGAAEMIMGTGQDVPEGLKRKMNSYLGAKIRVFAGKQPLRAEVIRAMMDPDYELKIGEEIIKPKGELLSLTAEEAIKTYGDPAVPLLGAGISPDLDTLIRQLHGSRPVEITRLEISWSEKLAQYITAASPILMGLGLLALFIEFRIPGFTIFGVVGALLLGIVFFGHHAAGLSGHEPALLFLVGLALVAVELFFAPGTFVAAITGLALMLASLVWAMLDYWPDEPLDFGGGVLVMPLFNVLAGVVMAVVLFLALMRFLPRGGTFGGLILQAAVGGEPTGIRALHAAPSDAPAGREMIGRSGVATTGLFPSGQVEIGGRRYEARLEVGFADPGTAVRVVEKKQFGLIVEVLS